MMRAILQIIPAITVGLLLLPEMVKAQTVGEEAAAETAVQILPAQSCLANVGDLGSTENKLPAAVDGTKLKRPSALRKIRKKAKDGRLIYVKGGNFAGWDMTKVKELSNICFEDADFSGSNWSGLSFSGLGFINSKLSGANLSNTQLPFVLFRTTSLDKAAAINANFRNGQMDGGWSASMEELDATGANFSSFAFNCGVSENDGCAFNRQGVKIAGADFSNASLIGFALWDSDWSGVKLDGAVVNMEQAGQFPGALIEDRILLIGGNQLRGVNGEEMKVVADLVNLAQSDSCANKSEESPARFACDIRDNALAAAISDIKHIDSSGNIPLHGPRSRTAFAERVKSCMTKEGEERQSCLSSRYNSQRNRLVARALEPEWTAEKGYALFVKTKLNVDNPASQNVIEKIAPLIAGTSSALLLMQRDEENDAWKIRSKLNVDGSKPCVYSSGEAMFRNGSLLSDVKRYRRSRRLISGIPAIEFFGERARFANSLFAKDAVSGETLAQCPVQMTDGMQKIPVSKDEFDQLWQSLVPPSQSTETASAPQS